MKPMLAGKCKDTSILKYPVFASTKLDGVRAVKLNGFLMSRSLKMIPNLYTQNLFSKVPEGTDGELIFGKPNDKDVYRRTVSAVMSVDGFPDVRFHVFDNFLLEGGFIERFDRICVENSREVIIVPHKLIYREYDLLAFEEECLTAGYEGVMIRSLDGPYKHGRSTVKEGYLLKLKRFLDSEAVILGVVELQHNENEAKVNELGRTARSTAKAGQVAGGVMGALEVQDVTTGVKFEIGTGFSAEERAYFWTQDLRGKIVKYKYFPMGSKDKPRHPVYLGPRDGSDL